MFSLLVIPPVPRVDELLIPPSADEDWTSEDEDEEERRTGGGTTKVALTATLCTRPSSSGTIRSGGLN